LDAAATEEVSSAGADHATPTDYDARATS
jgi:hypothetical protein